jgi:transposase
MRRRIAVDLHRRSIYVLIYEAGREVLRRRFTHDAAGITALVKVLGPGDQVVMEVTTGVFRLANRLESAGAEVFVLDAQETRAVGLKGKKTDYRDCRALLRYLDDPEPPVVWRPDLHIREIRQLTRERFAFNQALTRLKNRVRGLLADEGLQPPTGPWEPAGRAWLDEQVLSPRTRRILIRELAAIAVDEGLKEEQEAELAQLALACPLCQRLMQLIGFGAALAVMWKGEVGDLGRFPGAKQLTSYAGLDAKVNQSGERSRHGAISKAGRAQLRWIMVEVAWRHVQNDGPEAPYFHRLVARGKQPQVAIVALARRLLVLAYTLLQREETHRELDLVRYEAKLTRLAAQRPVSTAPEPCDRDWAADRVEELTGQTAPRRVAGKPRRLRPQRRSRAKPSAEAAQALSGRKDRKGSTSESPVNPERRPDPLCTRDTPKDKHEKRLPETASST